jgi:hypothetical protein
LCQRKRIARESLQRKKTVNNTKKTNKQTNKQTNLKILAVPLILVGSKNGVDGS